MGSNHNNGPLFCLYLADDKASHKSPQLCKGQIQAACSRESVETNLLKAVIQESPSAQVLLVVLVHLPTARVPHVHFHLGAQKGTK